MGLFDSIKKFINAAEDISKAVEKNQNKKPSEIVSTTTVKPAPPKANTKTSPADILSSGNIPAKASTQRKEEFFGGETGNDMFNVSFMLSGDFIEFNSHCEITPSFQYEPFSDSDYTDYEENLPQIGIGPDDNIYNAVEEFEENGTLPNDNYEKCDSDYFSFKCSFDAYGLKYYAYAFKSGTTREKEMLSLNYLPDICGTELEKKLKAALDEIASTYSETKAN